MPRAELHVGVAEPAILGMTSSVALAMGSTG